MININEIQIRTKEILSHHPVPSDTLIALLQDIQGEFGYLPMEVMQEVSASTGIAAAGLTGVASFYAQFRLTPPGKYQIMVCMGTACHVNKGETVADAVEEYLGVPEGKTTADGLFSWEKVACLGCCSLSPVMMINGRAYGKLTKDKVKAILTGLRDNNNGGAVN